MTKIAVLVGSLQAKSVNKLLARNLEMLAPEGTQFDYVDISTLPLFNQDLEANFPASAQAMKYIIESADGVLFVTPEYNRSISGVLKNAIDWASRPWGSNSFNGKPAGIVGATISPLGTGPAQSDLRHIAAYLGTKLMGQPELYLSVSAETFDENGDVTQSLRQNLQGYIVSLVGWIEDSNAPRVKLELGSAQKPTTIAIN